MEIQQELVTDIEKLSVTVNAIIPVVSDLLAYLNAPHTKVELVSYLKLNLIDQLFKDSELKRVPAKLVPQSTTYNSSLVLGALKYSGKDNFIPGQNVALLRKKVITDILDYMEAISLEIDKLPYDDIVERNIALRRSYIRLMVIMDAHFTTAPEPEQIPDIDIDSYSHISYMTESIQSLRKKIEESNWKINGCKDFYEWSDGGYWTLNGPRNLKALLNFVIYLGSLLRY